MDAWFWVWVGLAAVLSVAEIFTGGFFLLPFGLGAAVAALANYAGLGVGWQWTVFVGASAILLWALRRYGDRLTKESPQGVGADRLIGKCGVVTEALDHHAGHGMVRVQREQWRADAPGYEPVAVGTSVTVVKLEGAHLIVRPTDAECDNE